MVDGQQWRTARLAQSNRKLRSGIWVWKLLARRNDAIYDRERRTSKRRKKREKKKKSAENLNRPTEGRYVPLHLSSRPFPSAPVCICKRERVQALACVHTCEVTCRTVVLRRVSSSRGMFFSLGSREKGLNVLLLNHNARGRVVRESGRDRT